MKRYLSVLALLLILPLALPAKEYIMNGGFEQEFAPAWQEVVWGQPKTASDGCGRDAGYDADNDYEAMVKKEVAGNYLGALSLEQTVELDRTDLVLSVDAKFIALGSGLTADKFAVAGLAFQYTDWRGNLLGTTFYYRPTDNFKWTSTDTSHLVKVEDTLWHNYQFDLGDELSTYLTGVDRAKVEKAKVALYTYTNCC